MSARPPGEVSIEYVRLEVTEIIVTGLIIFLADLVPTWSGSMGLADIYRVLRDPEGLEDVNFAGKWLYACYREAIILLRIGGIAALIETIMRLKKESRGYVLLFINSRFNNEIRTILPKTILDDLAC